MSYITNETDHKHNKSHVVDDTVLFKVDPITRQIIKVDENDVVLVKNDHNSERYRISMPRYIDGHDMSLCDTARVHYINTGTTSGVASSDVYESDDLGLVIEEGMTAADATEISFTWLVANTATQEHGRLAFAIELCCTGDSTSDGYAWHSGVYADITVSDGIHNGKAIVGVYGDILQSWWEKITDVMGGSIEENSKEPFRFWIGTQEEYDALESEDIIPNCLYYISDDKTFDELKQKADDAYNHTTNKENPHEVTAAQVGAYSKDETSTIVSTAEVNAKAHANSVAQTAEDNATAYTEDRLGDIGTDNTVKDYADSVAQTAENNAKSHADSVASTAETNAKSYAETKASTAESNAKDYTDTHSGGHNLLPVSKGEYYTPATAGRREFVSTGIDLTPIFDKYGSVNYTLSADIKSENVDTEDTVQMYAMTDSGAYYMFSKTVHVTTEWARYSVTIKPTRNEEYTKDTRSILAFFGNVYGSGNCPHIRNIKLELGTVASDWTPGTNEFALKSETVPKLPWSAAGPGYRIYAQYNGDGQESYLWASPSTLTNSGIIIPIRNQSTGDIVVPETPGASNHAASKAYVDSKSTNSDHTNNKENPHGVTASQVGAYTKTESDAKYYWRKLIYSLDTPPAPSDSDGKYKYYVYSGPLDHSKKYELHIVGSTLTNTTIILPFSVPDVDGETTVAHAITPMGGITTGNWNTIAITGLTTMKVPQNDDGSDYYIQLILYRGKLSGVEGSTTVELRSETKIYLYEVSN